MIAFLSGQLLHKEHDAAVIDVQGVGYEVHLSARSRDSLPPPGGRVALHICTNVREDAITLYGFPDSSQKQLFLLLNTVSGIGPKLALAILSGMEPTALCSAISLKDVKRLTALPGVGKKTAERLCMELADKMQGFVVQFTPLPQTAIASTPPVAEGFALHDAASALMNLGYPQETAWKALRAVQQADPVKAAAMRVDELIRAALRTLA
ncbi:MAG: Holliday junction branch migration protein RuvA [Candidatus Electronema sp. V4]|uniref:Holliday junction branch migration protein RuvA n=1 Tax=Candidatus Electronema sp. V4 TaxID=3454756 RepID=UPI0040556988